MVAATKPGKDGALILADAGDIVEDGVKMFCPADPGVIEVADGILEKVGTGGRVERWSFCGIDGMLRCLWECAACEGIVKGAGGGADIGLDLVASSTDLVLEGDKPLSDIAETPASFISTSAATGLDSCVECATVGTILTGVC